MNRLSLLTALAFAAVSLVRAEAALAGKSCGGGSSSDGGSSGGGSSGGDSSGDSSSDYSYSFSSDDSGDSSSSSSVSTPACVGADDIHGYRKCSSFGTWSTNRRVPLVIIELGTAMRTFRSPLREATGNTEHEGESFSYRVVGQPAGPSAPPSDAAVVSTIRVGFGLPRGFYIAGDVEIGGITRTAGRAEMTSTGMFGAPSITPSGSPTIGALGVAGFRGELGRGSLGVEMAGGTRTISYNYESHYLSCVSTMTHRVSSSTLEARARASLWLSPFVNLGATAGASVIDRGGWMAGVHIGFVSQAYGNQRD